MFSICTATQRRGRRPRTAARMRTSSTSSRVLRFCYASRSEVKGVHREDQLCGSVGSSEVKIRGPVRELMSTHTTGTQVAPAGPFYLFVPHDGGLRSEYDRGWRATDIFPLHGVGAVMARDSITVAFAEEEFWRTATRSSLRCRRKRRAADLAWGKMPAIGRSKPHRPTCERTARKEQDRADALSTIRSSLYATITGRSKGFYASACANVMSHLLRAEPGPCHVAKRGNRQTSSMSSARGRLSATTRRR